MQTGCRDHSNCHKRADKLTDSLCGVDGMGELDLIAMRATSKCRSISQENFKSSEGLRPMPRFDKIENVRRDLQGDSIMIGGSQQKDPVHCPHTQNDLLEKDLLFGSLKEERKSELAQKRATAVQP